MEGANHKGLLGRQEATVEEKPESRRPEKKQIQIGQDKEVKN